MKIVTEYLCPPIPVRHCDWAAYDADTYDCDCDQDGFYSLSPVGYGSTEEEAIFNLREQLEDSE